MKKTKTYGKCIKCESNKIIVQSGGVYKCKECRHVGNIKEWYTYK